MHKVLIVDDNGKNRKLLRVVFQNSGYETIESENGEQGINMAKEKMPDIILIDIQMPVMDGIEAAKILKSESITKDIPVIAITSYAMSGDKERFLKQGFDGYISKPIDVRKILDIVSEIIQQKDKRIKR